MHDIENIVIKSVKQAVDSCNLDAVVYSDYINAPEHFPCVFVTEDSSTTYEKTLDASGTEHHSKVMYAVNVYADNEGNKKTVAKTLIKAVDDKMISLGFYRVSCERLPNQDRTIYRIMARYQGIVGEAKYIQSSNTYKTTIYKS